MSIVLCASAEHTEAAEVSDAAVAVNESGSCAPASLILVPGFAQGAHSWDDILAVLPDNVQAEVFSYGDGSFGTFSTEGGAATIAKVFSYKDGSFDSSTQMQDVLVALAEVVRACTEAAGKPPVVVGYSQGGRLVAEAVARDVLPSVSGIVIESGAFGPRDKSEHQALAERAKRWVAQLREQGAQGFMDAWADLPLFESQRALPEERQKILAAGRACNSEENLAWQIQELGQHQQHSHSETLEAFRVRAPRLLYVAGERDAKYSALGAAIVAALGPEKATFASIPGAGHNTHFERPDAFVSVLQEWL